MGGVSWCHRAEMWWWWMEDWGSGVEGFLIEVTDRAVVPRLAVLWSSRLATGETEKAINRSTGWTVQFVVR